MKEIFNAGEKPSKITRDSITKHLVEYQLQMVGRTLLDTIDDDNWHFNITMTTEQKQKFKTYAVKLIRKTFKCNRLKGEDTFNWFDREFGIRIKNK